MTGMYSNPYLCDTPKSAVLLEACRQNHRGKLILLSVDDMSLVGAWSFVKYRYNCSHLLLRQRSLNQSKTQRVIRFEDSNADDLFLRSIYTISVRCENPPSL